MGYFYSIVNTCASKWTRNGKLKLKPVRPEKNKGSMTLRGARMPTLVHGVSGLYPSSKTGFEADTEVISPLIFSSVLHCDRG